MSYGCCNKVPQMGRLKQRKCTAPQGWRLDVGDQGAGRVGFPEGHEGELSHGPLLASGGSLAICSVPQLLEASPSTLLPAHMASAVCASVCASSPFCKDTSHIRLDPIFTNDICHDPLSKQGHLALREGS